MCINVIINNNIRKIIMNNNIMINNYMYFFSYSPMFNIAFMEKSVPYVAIKQTSQIM